MFAHHSPGVTISELHEITSFIRDGVTLSFTSTPPDIVYSNSLSVYANIDAVRARMKEYIAFGAVRQVYPPTSTATATLLHHHVHHLHSCNHC